MFPNGRMWLPTLLCIFAFVWVSGGCHSTQIRHDVVFPEMPRELCKGVMPPYRIEPPDILTIDAVHVTPKEPYHVRTYDVLDIQAQGVLPDAPISGVYRVEPGGRIRLGLAYAEFGDIKVAGKTVQEIEADLRARLAERFAAPAVAVSLAELAAPQQISGEHLVAPDGTVTLGQYGSVTVVGMTVEEAKQAVEAHLSGFFEDPEVAINVFAYNSKVYYIITQGAGLGDGVFRNPVMGSETVLDAVASINGLDSVSSKDIWIARPGPNSAAGDQILPVDWNAITKRGCVDTNYQVLPGDRIYIAADRLITLDNQLAKFISPLERIMGFSILTVGAVTRFSGSVLEGGGNGNSNF